MKYGSEKKSANAHLQDIATSTTICGAVPEPGVKLGISWPAIFDKSKVLKNCQLTYCFDID